MTTLSLSPSTARGGYAAQKKRSPSALAFSIALNGGVFALIVALPATQYLVQRQKPLTTISIPLDPLPPDPVDPIKPTSLHPTPHPVPQPQPDPQPFVDPIMKTGGDTVVSDSRPADPLGTVELNPVVPPVHVPVFVKASQDPRYAQAFHPDYPPTLRRAGLEGSATVRITIDESGKVIACELVKATDRAFFDETRAQALRYWRFRPATSDGAPIQSQQVLTVQFRLEEQ